MKNFIKYTFASMLGILLLFLILLFIGIGIGSSQEEPIKVKDNSILKVTLNKIVEREPLNPFADFSFGDKGESKLVGLNKILKAIESAKNDEKIKGLYLDAGTFNGGGIATVEAVRKALVDFRTSGKFIYAYAEFYSQKSYYIASVADKIYLNPVGAVEIKGLGAELMFFKNAMDKFGVDMQIIRGPNNKFKSAVEPFMYDKMSEANREQMMVFMHSIWDDMVKQMATDRNISIADFNVIADSLWASDPVKAKELHIIDELAYYDEVQDMLVKKMEAKKFKDLNFISMGDYSSTVKKKNVSAKKKIAIIYAVGEIQSGEGNDEVIGSDRIAKAVAKARQDSSIKAIVLRVNSPGGSALASEVMWRELVLAKKDKPLVVSMGDYAASGGYYISCMADKIVAQPTTLTGSIGVFGMIPNIQKLLNEKIGITTDEVSTNANSVITTNRPLTPFQVKSIQKGVVNIYTTFITHVAEGRGMTPEQVDNIGQGRVWSGANAVKIGLVDELGGMQKALEIAAEMANITEYKTVEYPSRKNPIEEMFKQFSNSTSASAAIKTELGDNYKYYQYLKKIQSMEGVQARLPFFVELY
jgi:protease-4